MLRTALVLPLSLSLLATSAFAQEGEKDLWTQDFAAAKAKAKAEKKDLLVDFTGSDWCGWCIRLDNEVFAKDEFQAAAPKDFVLVKLDYPNDKSILTEAVLKQNEELQQTYKIQGFPTILLMDHEGRVYAQAGYQEGGPEPYNKMLAEAKKAGATFKAAMATADAKKGIERATALDDALESLAEGIAPSYHFDLMKEIVLLDVDGAAGLKKKYAKQVAEIEEANQANAMGEEFNKLIMDDIQANEPDKAIAKLDEVIKTAEKDVLRKQMATFFRAMVFLRAKQDKESAIAGFEAAQAMKPDSVIGKQIDEILPQIKQG